MNIGDIVYITSQAETSYKVVELRSVSNGGKKIPSVIQRCDNTGKVIDEYKIQDTWKEWHKYTWVIKKSIHPIILSEADKKYEKIVLKVKQLQHKFENRKLV